MVCRPTTIVFPGSMFDQLQTYFRQMRSRGLGTYPANMYVILTVISLTNGDREVTKDILLMPQAPEVLGVNLHPDSVANSLTFSPILKEGNDSMTPCTRISKEQNQITVNLGGNKSESVEIPVPLPWLLSFKHEVNTQCMTLKH